MTNPVPTNGTLPRSVDVQVTVSMSQTEIATDMTLGCIVTNQATGFLPTNDRVRYYSELDSAVEDLGISVSSSLYWALSAFFSNTSRPNTIAVGQVFTNPTNAVLTGGAPAVLSNLKSVSNGSLSFSVSDTPVNITGVDLSEINDFSDVATLINATKGTGGVPENFEVFATDNGVFSIKSSDSGDTATITFASPTSDGTDLGVSLNLTESAGATKYDGYTPGDLVSEMTLIDRASSNNGRKIFAYCLDSNWRDTQDAKDVAAWIMSDSYHKFGVFCTNLDTAYDTSDTNNIGYVLKNTGNIACACIYHNNPQYFPDVSYMATLLGVNYSLADSTLVMKFKDMPGIPTTPVNETMLTNLESRNINCFTLIGNGSRTVREGTNGAVGWWSDTYVNLCNMVETVSTNVYNVFLRNKKIPYSKRGQNLIISAISQSCDQYVTNGALAPREIEDKQAQDGVGYEPAYKIIPQPMSSVTSSQRASRVGPPVQVIVNESGAIQSIAIQIDVVQ